MSEPSWLVLFKFGERTHLEEFRKGILHMNPQRYFSKLENDCVRTDRFEGFDQIHQPKDVTSLRITDKATGTEIMIGPEGLAGPLAIDPPRVFVSKILLRKLELKILPPKRPKNELCEGLGAKTA